MKIANYYLTEHGVIDKLATYWDQLRDYTEALERISQPMMYRLFANFSTTSLLTIVVFWLNLERRIALILLALLVLGGFSMMLVQALRYLDFIDTRRKGQILYHELAYELDNDVDYESREDLAVEERILLSNFELACELPIPAGLYLFLMAVTPIFNITFFSLYYLFV